MSSISGITEIPILTAASTPWGIAEGPDGNLWFTEQGTNKIGVINPTTHAISEFATPTANSDPQGIVAGPDGNLWFTEYQAAKIGAINITTYAINEYAITLINNPGTNDPIGITAGPDGNVWFTEIGSAIGMINPATHAISQFSVYPSGGRYPYGITAGPDGNVWSTDWSANGIGVISPVTDAISEFTIGHSNASRPYSITAGPDGNLWFTDTNPGLIGTINPTTHTITKFPVLNPKSVPFGITAGPDGNLWFTEFNVGEIGVINPMTGAMTEFPVPYANAAPRKITAGPDGKLWFTDQGTNSVDVATLATSQLVVTQQPPASVAAGSPFGLTVQAEDSSGNLDSSFNGTVTVGLANNPGGATLGGTLTATASNGVATFSGLTITKAASGYTLSASGGGFGWGVTSAFSVTAAAPTQLAITQQPPATVKVSSAFGLQASIEDQYGNVVTTAASTVSVAFANNPTGATLGGTLTATASQGVATFSGLTINKTGSGYTLRVTSSGLNSAVTSAINVTKTGSSNAIVAQGGINPPDSLLAPLVLDSPDLWDIPGLKKRARST